MGNICSRSSNEPDAFSGPGRIVGAPSPDQSAAPRASVPANTNWKSTPGRTLGDSAGPPGGEDEARSNAAIAAQKRAEAASASASKGKLSSKLATEKAQTQNQILSQASQGERSARDADDAQKAREWN
ncbi:hypothetical protein N7462_000502 [Penicillium macrosclerotiorum]|uniref:uncharacterized protein n=1 Tax=Penicillium macrosclerotiorum TaxID=303699 RepID=UPI00254978C7|nr:uncharacterized protein N7462_000502 [Penicillium macrosclerotiorum]KAJ5698497.1 hypothetical protein N7462_000502 [Penicillium macrosclerotiorum]